MFLAPRYPESALRFWLSVHAILGTQSVSATADEQPDGKTLGKGYNCAGEMAEAVSNKADANTKPVRACCPSEQHDPDLPHLPSPPPSYLPVLGNCTKCEIHINHIVNDASDTLREHWATIRTHAILEV